MFYLSTRIYHETTFDVRSESQLIFKLLISGFSDVISVKSLGGYEEKTYICIRLAASQQLKQASLRSICTIFASGIHFKRLEGEGNMNMVALNNRLTSKVPHWHEIEMLSREDKIDVIALLSMSIAHADEVEKPRDRTQEMIERCCGSWVGEQSAEESSRRGS